MMIMTPISTYTGSALINHYYEWIFIFDKVVGNGFYLYKYPGEYPKYCFKVKK